MPHTMSIIEPGILRVSLIGDFGGTDLQAYNQEFEQYLAKATVEQPLRMLVDAHQEGRMSAAARRDFAQRMQDPRMGRTAVINAKRMNRVMGTFIAKASGRTDEFQFFDSEAEAMAWLKAET